MSRYLHRTLTKCSRYTTRSVSWESCSQLQKSSAAGFSADVRGTTCALSSTKFTYSSGRRLRASHEAVRRQARRQNGMDDKERGRQQPSLRAEAGKACLVRLLQEEQLCTQFSAWLARTSAHIQCVIRLEHVADNVKNWLRN